MRKPSNFIINITEQFYFSLMKILRSSIFSCS